MLLIVGLGNPSAEYENTFHNMGFKAIDNLAEKLGKKIKKNQCRSLTATFSVKGENIVLAKPQTYMNLSGEAVKSLMSKYGIAPSEIIVLFDDVDIDRYTIRARSSGSAGTHNGMKNIVSKIETTEFKRIRIGIGRGEGELSDFVLSRISKEEMEQFSTSINIISEAVFKYVYDRDFDKLARQINTKPQKEKKNTLEDPAKVLIDA